ncbi:hypothetical protein QA642_00550 [Bradyrhizobium sp. CB2312]|nr:hypothetical protein [Bradyrhizobium sp. CB2312]WFU72608.1 hypothetical protein QA642_00550 [Bradyrhizobium sp. CB2312]
MSAKKPVIVYGASGYTGRLVCEYLREYNIPFIAAGRSAGKLNAAMKANVAGIETADYEVVEVPHTVSALSELFNGASVVLNTVGPSPDSAARWCRRVGLPDAITPTRQASRTG